MARVNSSDGAVAEGFVEGCKKVSRLWWRWRVNLKTLKP